MLDATPTNLTIKVGDIVAADYRTAAVFEKHGIDFCCGGSVTLSAACAEKAIDPSTLTRELEAATSAPERRDQDYASWTLTRLIGHITAVHHAFLKANTAQNAAYARKIADVHGDHHPELVRIAAVLDKMATELMDHLKEEEEVVFPAIRRVEAGSEAGTAAEAADAEIVARGVETLAREHEEVGAALHDIRALSMGYALPPDACATYTLTYQRLQAFETDLHKHVHLENNILFPGATERCAPSV